MRITGIAIAALCAVAGIEAQAIQGPFSVNAGGAGQTIGLSPIPTIVFGVPSRPLGLGRGGIGQGFGQGVSRSGMYFGAANPAGGYLLNPGFGGLNGYYYWTPGTATNPVPTGPSYENPGPVRAVGALPAPLQAPEQPNASEEWNDARLSFTAASAKVSSARLAVEELRARLESIGQSPRANLATGTTSAEASLKMAQERMAAGDLEGSLREIQRSNYLAAQVLKEFGR